MAQTIPASAFIGRQPGLQTHIAAHRGRVAVISRSWVADQGQQRPGEGLIFIFHAIAPQSPPTLTPELPHALAPMAFQDSTLSVYKKWLLRSNSGMKVAARIGIGERNVLAT